MQYSHEVSIVDPASETMTLLTRNVSFSRNFDSLILYLCFLKLRCLNYIEILKIFEHFSHFFLKISFVYDLHFLAEWSSFFAS